MVGEAQPLWTSVVEAWVRNERHRHLCSDVRVRGRSAVDISARNGSIPAVCSEHSIGWDVLLLLGRQSIEHDTRVRSGLPYDSVGEALPID